MIIASVSILVGVVGFVLGQSIANYTRSLDDQFDSVYRQFEEERRELTQKITEGRDESDRMCDRIWVAVNKLEENVAKGKK